MAEVNDNDDDIKRGAVVSSRYASVAIPDKWFSNFCLHLGLDFGGNLYPIRLRVPAPGLRRKIN